MIRRHTHRKGQRWLHCPAPFSYDKVHLFVQDSIVRGGTDTPALGAALPLPGTTATDASLISVASFVLYRCSKLEVPYW